MYVYFVIAHGLLLAMKYITLVRVFSYNVERGAECGCGNGGQTVIKLGAL